MKLGFFDSGVGGLTILEEVHKRLPQFDTIYLGDSARAPYGEKSHEELVQYLIEAAEWLFGQGCELVVVACNSASASALREVQQEWLPDYPGKKILGIIRPTVEALANKEFEKVLVLSTLATTKSEAYVHEFKKLNPEIEVLAHACPRWAPMVEEGKAGGLEMKFEVDREMREALKLGTPDAVLLACTHYPYVKNDVEQSLPANIPVFNQGLLVALSLKDYLDRHTEITQKLATTSTYEYFTTGDPVAASKIATDRFGFEVEFQPATL